MKIDWNDEIVKFWAIRSMFGLRINIPTPKKGPSKHTPEEFTAAREFNFLVSRLQFEEMSRMEHGQVEATIAQESNELLRRLLRGHLGQGPKGDAWRS